MGSYCKFCGLRCFKYTDKNSYIKTDLEATCFEGIKHDLNCTYPTLKDKKDNHIAWVIEEPRHKQWFKVVEFKNELREFEIETNQIEEVIDLVNGNSFYRLIK